MTEELQKVVRLAGLTTTSNRKLYQLVRNEVESYERYSSGDLRVIGLPGFDHLDCIVKDKLSYADWCILHNTYSVTKVEGIEKNLKVFRAFRLKVTDIHLFVANRSNYSFKWHTDKINVCLYVLQGTKRLQIRNKTFLLRAGQWAIIPKGHLHRAFNCKNTWALSIGFK